MNTNKHEFLEHGEYGTWQDVRFGLRRFRRLTLRSATGTAQRAGPYLEDFGYAAAQPYRNYGRRARRSESGERGENKHRTLNIEGKGVEWLYMGTS